MPRPILVIYTNGSKSVRLRCRPNIHYLLYFCLVLFALIVPHSMVGLKEQVFIQMILGLLRLFLLSMMLIYCLVQLIQGDSELQEKLTNTSSEVSHQSYIGDNGSNMTDSVVLPCYLELYHIVVKFEWSEWLAAIPVMTYSFTVHHSIPTLTHPIREKKYLRQFIVCAYSFVGLCYLSLGVVVPLWFRTKTQGTATLSWVSCSYRICK